VALRGELPAGQSPCRNQVFGGFFFRFFYRHINFFQLTSSQFLFKLCIEKNPFTNHHLLKSSLVQVLLPLLLKVNFLYKELFSFKTEDFMFGIKVAFRLFATYVSHSMVFHFKEK